MNYRAYVTRVLSLTINDLDINKGFIRSGKVKGKQGLFHLSQRKSGKVRETCNSQGKNSIFILQVRERISFFIIKEVFRFFSLSFNFFFPFVLSRTCIIVVFRVGFLGTVLPVEMFDFCLR